MVKMMGDRKLSSEQVREIRRRYAGGNTCKVLAMEYGVSTATISNYVLGVKREPADRNERVSFGGDPLPSELNAANAGNGAAEKQGVNGAEKTAGAAEKQHGKDKPGGCEKAVDTVKDGGAVTAEYAGDTNIKNMSGADKQDVSGAEKTAGAAEKQRGKDKPGGGDKAVGMAKDSAVQPENDVSGADEKQGVNGAENTAGAAEKQCGGDVPVNATDGKGVFGFPKKLCELFNESGRSYYDLVDFIQNKAGKHISDESIRCWCRGKYFPNVVNITLIAEFFGVSIEYLLTDIEDKGVKTDGSGADGLDVCDLATGFFMFLEKNISGDISINILRRDGIVEIKISSKDEELAFKRRVGGSGGGGA